MSLPPSLLSALESHPCFSGTFRYSDTVQLVLDPAQPPEVAFTVQCDDCLLWHAGALRSLLPAGVDGYALARQATAHVSTARGYDAAIGGYHGGGAGFWLSAVYLASIDAFLLDGHRSRATATDLDLLLRSFTHKLWSPADPGMTDPARYVTQTIHVSMAHANGPWPTLQDFLTSPVVHASASAQTRTVTLAAWQRATAPTAAPPAATTAAPSPAAPLREGDRCPTCGHEVRWRTLLTSDYLGCMC